jgi:hypothetical protein
MIPSVFDVRKIHAVSFNVHAGFMSAFQRGARVSDGQLLSVRRAYHGGQWERRLIILASSAAVCAVGNPPRAKSIFLAELLFNAVHHLQA